MKECPWAGEPLELPACVRVLLLYNDSLPWHLLANPEVGRWWVRRKSSVAEWSSCLGSELLPLTAAACSPVLTRSPLTLLGWLLILTFRGNRVGSCLPRVMWGENKSMCEIPSPPQSPTCGACPLSSRNVWCGLEVNWGWLSLPLSSGGSSKVGPQKGDHRPC